MLQALLITVCTVGALTLLALALRRYDLTIFGYARGARSVQACLDRGTSFYSLHIWQCGPLPRSPPRAQS